MNILAILVQLRNDLKSWVSLNFEALNKKIDKKSRARFSRDYHDLYNAPQIIEDDKKELSVADEQGNVIFKLDKDGAHTTNLTLNGEEAASQKYVQEAIESIDFPETDLTGYATKEFVKEEVAGLVDAAPEALNTLGELAVAIKDHEDAYDALLETVGQKATLEQLQALEKNFNEGAVSEGEEYSIADKNGLVAFKVNKNGVTETANLKTKELTINEKTLDKHLEDALQPYATLESVKQAIEEIDFPETDLSNYPTKEDVQKSIEEIDFPETDLTGYATEQYVDKKVADLVDSAPEALNTLGELAEAMGEHEDAYDALLETVGQKATREEVKDLEKALNNGAESDAEEYCIADKDGNMIFKADKDGVETTAVKTKALTVDGKDLATHIQNAIEDIEFPETDLSNYPTKGEVEQAIADIEFPVTDLTGYATEEFVKEEINKIDFPETDLTGYATEEYVRNKIAEAQLEGEEIDLSGYATKEEIKNFITEIPENYVEEEELQSALDEATKELNEHLTSEDEEFQIVDNQGLVAFKVDKEGVTHAAILKIGQEAEEAATKKYVDEAIGKIDFPETDLTEYATKEEVRQAIEEIEFPETDLSNYTTKEDVKKAIEKIDFPKTDLTGYATEEFVNDAIGKIEFPETDLTGYATESYVDKAIEEIEFPVTDLSGYATEEFVGKAIEAIDFPETDLSDYATKQNVEDAVLAHKQDTDIHITKEEREGWFDGKYDSLEGAPSIDEADDKTYSIADPEGNVIFKVDENGTHTTNLTINGEVATTKQYVDGAIKQAVDNIDIPEVDLSNHATKQYVDEAIDNIEFPVTDLTDYATKQYVEEQVGPKAAQTDLDLANQELGKVKELVGTTSVEDQIEEALDNLETFSGDYEDLINAPDIAEDGSGDMAVADKDGNVAFKVDSEGRTHVTSLAIGGESLESILESKVEREEFTLAVLGITYGKTDLTPGVSPLPTGHFYFVYE